MESTPLPSVTLLQSLAQDLVPLLIANNNNINSLEIKSNDTQIKMIAIPSNVKSRLVSLKEAVSKEPNQVLYLNPIRGVAKQHNIPHDALVALLLEVLVRYEVENKTIIGITHLSLSGCQFKSLPRLPSSITIFDASHNNLSSIPHLPPSITTLDLSHNNLSSIPPLPRSITTLDLSHNILSSIPPLPRSITTLNVSHNNLNSIPPLPPSITTLDISRNRLDSIPPPPPPSITTLDLSHNNLSSIPSLPPSITTLDASHNHLTDIPWMLRDCPQLTHLDLSFNLQLPHDLAKFFLPHSVTPNNFTFINPQAALSYLR